MTNSARKIAVIGGGLGGLAAELALHGAGFDVDVYGTLRKPRSGCLETRKVLLQQER